MNGVLASWAVPKGPTLDPAAKRRAVHVEDHPIEYIDFEGVIPAGEYGGGDVIVWDTGTWEPHEQATRSPAVAAGELHADVTGRSSEAASSWFARAPPRGLDQWLLLHKHDDYAVAGWDAEDHPQSVFSGRTNEQVKADPDRIWRSDLPAAEASVERGGGQRRDRGGARRAGPDGQRRRRGNLRPRAAADQSRQEAIPGEAGRAGGHQARVGQRCGADGAGDFAVPGRPGAQHERFPGGAAQPGFWNKQLPDHAPAWLPRWHNPDAKEGRTTTYLVVDEPGALIWAANYGALEWHAWTSLAADQGSRPTR